MLAIIYLTLSIYTGTILVRTFLPKLGLEGAPENADLFPRRLIVLPASFTVGVIFSGWITYLAAYVFRASGRPLFYGTLLSMIILALIGGGTLWRRRKRPPEARAPEILKTYRPVLIFMAAVSLFIIWLMTYTFFVRDGKFQMGYTIFSDFAVHTALIRSFSFGANFPTSFPHFPDGTIRYHFMFQFFTGVLEYLGMRMDIALNFMSAAGLISCSVLLYIFASLLTSQRAVGLLTVVFFFFRSSFSGLRYVYENAPYQSAGSFIRFILNTSSFIGKTSGEEAWGLWNINVYANQRHFALGISLLLITLIAMLPYVQKMLAALSVSPPPLSDAPPSGPSSGFRMQARAFIASKDAWLCDRVGSAVFLGVLIGGAAFFNGACVIAVLSILAVLAVFSKHRLNFLIIAVIAYALSTLEASFFAPGVEIAKLSLRFGFISPDKSPAGVARYIIELTGVCLFVAVLALSLRPKKYAPFFFAFAVPFVITFSLSLTPDVTVNHKYLMISLALLNIFTACGVWFLASHQWQKRWLGIGAKILAAVLFSLMVFTGVIDLMSERNLNGIGRSASMPVHSQYQDWLIQNTKPNDIFLTYWDSLSEIFFAGRFEFNGWPYYAWSAGYATDLRGAAAKAMYAAGSPDELRRLTRENNIAYIVINPDVINNVEWPVNEQNIADTFPLVYSDEEVRLSVYQVIEQD
ncbi:MAG: hypothetical protein LBT44_01450 [Clostridiales bacterium]|nr:hypothetical protein [Clostridiales bacterium]